MLSSICRPLARIGPKAAAMAYSTQPGTAFGPSLKDSDPEMYAIIEDEKKRQKESLTLIPSENFTSRAVMDALGSEMQNKYSEGYPGARYYGGNEIIDKSERLCQTRALRAFKLDSDSWGVNVQPLSGSPANLEAISAICEVGDRVMGLDLPHGGHLSHGYQTPKKKISYVSKYFTTMPYRLDPVTELIDYDALANSAQLFRPKVIIAGTSAYSRLLDYKRFREIADSVGAYLLADMAHIAGLVSAGVIPSPFEYADIVTTTTHKSLRGPRGAMIFARKELMPQIDFSVFPAHQGGPHNHTIAALSVALGQCTAADYVEYQKMVLENAQALSMRLSQLGVSQVSGGTDNHLLLLNLKQGANPIDGARVEAALDLANIATNKNTVAGDKSAITPGGLRIGTPAMTTRGFGPKEFERVADLLVEGIEHARRVASVLANKTDPTVKTTASARLRAFKAAIAEDSEILEMGERVREWVSQY
ncbi:hypothetical protein CANCADRAFT_23607 [Tortispora caseinolytica NRRL Y-17796]|uniref:Serine hydroxymethyltransferase n=1 Tax=Tortispora caseinolytica NRRL Y-17796 TaxID=767744 RepID=A0A1E4TJQ1_9ASCO|nr:hypothetical protein CANCADRAFT_23607 [Tortispora caseinolytica NRRL Y-17796]